MQSFNVWSCGAGRRKGRGTGKAVLERRKSGQETESKTKCGTAVNKFSERSKVLKFCEIYPRGAFEGVGSVFMRRELVREAGKGGF